MTESRASTHLLILDLDIDPSRLHSGNASLVFFGGILVIPELKSVSLNDRRYHRGRTSQPAPVVP